MKTLQKVTLIFFIGIIVSAPACKKEGTLSTRELLLNHPWNFNKATTTSTDQNVQNTVAFVQALFTGAVLEFNDNGTYVLTALNLPDSGVWVLSDDETRLFMGDDLSSLDANQITTISNDQLVLESTASTDELGTYTISLWWIR